MCGATLLTAWFASVALTAGAPGATTGRVSASAPCPTGKYSARTSLVGYSARHRPIIATEVGAPHASKSVLIIGSISGDEPGGIAVASALATCRTIPGVDLWLLPDMNPDGLGARTRVNANGVDLNRNFPFSWRPLGPKGSRNYAGPRPLSEPESASVAALIRRIRPTVGVWFHQPYGLIDDSQGPQTFEHSLALLANLPEAKLPDFPGSAIGWEDHLFRNSAFDVELPGALSLTAIARDAQALYTVASTLTPRRGG